MTEDEELVSPMSNLSISANTILVGSVNNPEVDQSDEGGDDVENDD